MTTYTAIANGTIDTDSPITQPIVTAFRDNCIAITEGSPGAPRNQDASLSGTATATGGNWVAQRTALLGAGGVGTYALMKPTATTTVDPGDDVAGSGLRFSAVSGSTSSTVPSGTWQCVGYSTSGATTLFLRVS
jgi:hypothetical protein